MIFFGYMEKRDTLIGLIVIILVFGLGYAYYKKVKPTLTIPAPTTTYKKEIESAFGLIIPDDVDSVDLTSVNGSDSRGIATRKYEDGTFTHSVLADLPELSGKSFYQGWLVRGSEGDENYALVSTGALTLAKGGFVLEFTKSTDYSDYQKVVVSLETKLDTKIETTILEGSF